jgi:hypothetical protein
VGWQTAANAIEEQAACIFKVKIHLLTRREWQDAPLKFQYPFTKIYGVKQQITAFLAFMVLW